MVVFGHSGEFLNVVVEIGREPNVFADDLDCVLHLVAIIDLILRQPPASITSGTGLLRNGQSDTLLKGTGHKSTLAVTGATRNADPLGVDLCSRCHLQSVDDTADTPHPGSHGTGTVCAAVELVEETLASAGSAVLLSHVAVTISQCRDLYVAFVNNL